MYSYYWLTRFMWTKSPLVADVPSHFVWRHIFLSSLSLWNRNFSVKKLSETLSVAKTSWGFLGLRTAVLFSSAVTAVCSFMKIVGGHTVWTPMYRIELNASISRWFCAKRARIRSSALSRPNQSTNRKTTRQSTQNSAT